MKVIVLIVLIFISLHCKTAWYRQLPELANVSTETFIGTWRKKANPRSAINSSWHKNRWTEIIRFHSGFTFSKIYESEDLIGKNLIYKKVTGTGIYSVAGNWILLKTTGLDSIEKKDGELIKNESKNSESSLLYYYYKEENLIIPMIYDMGYNEKDFGVKDGVTVPYDEKNFNFFRYIKIYAFKEFQSHAYYPEN